jgi:hypothetical protein
MGAVYRGYDPTIGRAVAILAANLWRSSFGGPPRGSVEYLVVDRVEREPTGN